MVRFFVRVAVFVLSAALGLLVASLLIDGVHVTWRGYVVTVIVFAILQSVLTPFIGKMADRYAPAFVGGVGLVSTFVALLVTSLLRDALTIRGGATTWVVATLVVWLVTALATVLLPKVFVVKRIRDRDR